ncbi:MAG: uroporphyrinogen decarboxylase family protein [Bacteroidales bacterium]|nr:uroporphyrinogen decarboxylase family protein [Bacteroidales bacterium]MDT8374308.1 uroporphyrinogen decarboxylase family protein [Bacteroidales bacterium]
MNERHWETLLRIIDGERTKESPIGFIIDSPWLPGWHGSTILEYFTDPETWFAANIQAMRTFPEAIFLPGFWAEYGMCTEPSAFGTKLVWTENDFPHPVKLSCTVEAISSLARPNVKTDGLLPFVISRMKKYEERLKQNDCHYRFASSRGPLNIASFLFGTTDFMLALAITPGEAQKALTVITDFVIDWLTLQYEKFPDIEGVFLLDDIVGFLGQPDFEMFVLPHMKRIYRTFNPKVSFFHNDASGIITAGYLEEMGVNLFNFSFNHSVNEMRELAGESVTLLGNLPPRDVLALGTPADVEAGVREMMNPVSDTRRVIWSCGGGMPPDASTENIRTFIKTVRSFS